MNFFCYLYVYISIQRACVYVYVRVCIVFLFIHVFEPCVHERGLLTGGFSHCHPQVGLNWDLEALRY